MMERAWQEIRQAAMDVLRPTEKELKHGLELHRESIVFDAYGFMPVCRGNDSPRLEAMIADGAGFGAFGYHYRHDQFF